MVSSRVAHGRRRLRVPGGHKVRYATEQAARSASAGLAQHEQALGLNSRWINAYRCPHCGGWHVGHSGAKR